MTIIENNFTLLLVGMVLITYSVFRISDVLSLYAEQLTDMLGLSSGLVGFILIAAITSVPELVGTVFSVQQSLYGLAVGGVLGSNAVNIAILSAIFLIFRKVSIQMEESDLFAFLASLILLSVLSMVMLFFPLYQIIPNRAIVFIVIFTFYILIMKHMNKLTQQAEDINAPQNSQFDLRILLGFIVSSVILIVLAMALVFVCGKLVKAPLPLLNITMSENFVGVLFLAFATSVPELATCYQLVKNNNASMAIGNISGSNVFNLMALTVASLGGVSDFWSKISMNYFFTIFVIIMITVMLMVIALIKESKKTIIGINGLIILIWIASLVLIF